MKYYYCEKTGKVSGPVSIEEIKALIFKGDLGQDPLVCPEESEDWVAFSIALSKEIPRVSSKPFASTAYKLPDEQKTSTCSPVINSAMKEGRHARQQPAIDVKFLITAALALINAGLLLAILLSLPRLESEGQVMVQQGPVKYEYKLQHVDRETLQFYKEKHYSIETLLEMYQPGGGWEYVGPLCNDGVNATWLLMRRSVKGNHK